jgi:hypothetical protein
METKNIASLKRRKTLLMKKISTQKTFVRGTITTLYRRCGNKKCACAKDNNKKHAGIYLSTNLKGKTKLIYLGKKKKEIAEQMINNFKNLKNILDEIIELNIDILKLTKIK